LKVIGLTGGIAAGKSTVAEIFKAKGAAVLDADLVSRSVIAPGTIAHSGLVSYFGREILAEGDQIDRARLAALSFQDDKSVKALDNITHPEIFKEISKWLANLDPTMHVAVVEAALLIETIDKWNDGLSFDAMVVVSTSPELQLERLRSFRQMNEHDSLSRINAQAPAGKKTAAADFVIENRGTLIELRREAELVWEALVTL